MKLVLGILLPLLILAGCKEDSAALSLPDPVVLTEEAAGHYCQMIILEHPGPKAQVHLAGYPAPLWFSQVRDGIAYLKSPEQSAEIRVLYVNDMGRAVSWDEPGSDNWIDANDAYFVIGSDAVGGMGAPEIAPFGDMTKAQDFVQEHGGVIMRLNEIPAETVLSPVEFNADLGGLSGDNS
ncbi:MAG: copper resistance protein CopZ [Marinosulfonomonas sp.]|nr:MAG: copper resistance protein CopZ [Marinosulfonomonas sp.]